MIPPSSHRGRNECREYYKFLVSQLSYVSLCIAYSHVDETGKVIWGTLVHIKCFVKIIILSPVDPADHWMVVIVTGSHTHAIPRPHKPSIEGEITYRDLAKKFKESSIASLTARRLANGQSFSCCVLVLLFAYVLLQILLHVKQFAMILLVLILLWQTQDTATKFLLQ
jgi:hypothetical protein